MALGWLTVLKSVPWSDVISNAPKVADGAKKLWNVVSRKPALPEVAVAHTNAHRPQSSDAPTLFALAARVAQIEAAAVDLHAQMVASSELIQALAEQNAQLIKRMEVYRVRVLCLSLATAALFVAAVLAWFMRHGA
jgi:cystathionine beta-lyase/cystathionine gamma-synthase